MVFSPWLVERCKKRGERGWRRGRDRTSGGKKIHHIIYYLLISRFFKLHTSTLARKEKFTKCFLLMMATDDCWREKKFEKLKRILWTTRMISDLWKLTPHFLVFGNSKTKFSIFFQIRKTTKPKKPKKKHEIQWNKTIIMILEISHEIRISLSMSLLLFCLFVR